MCLRERKPVILVALGANVPSPAGQPAETLLAALRELAQCGITIEKQSGFYRNPAWPDPRDPPFINAVARINTELSPAALLDLLHQVEARFGRTRHIPNAPRTLDLDLLDYNGFIQDGPPSLPHPRMKDRAFVLVPLKDVAPDWRDPVSGQSVTDLIAALPPSQIERVA